MPAGVSALRRLGVPDGAGGAPFHGVRYHTGSRVAVGRFPASAEHGDRGRAQRRLVLDRLPLRAGGRARRASTAHQGVAVDGPVDRERPRRRRPRQRRRAARRAGRRRRRRALALPPSPRAQRAGAALARRRAAPLPAGRAARRRRGWTSSWARRTSSTSRRCPAMKCSWRCSRRPTRCSRRSSRSSTGGGSSRRCCASCSKAPSRSARCWPRRSRPRARTGFAPGVVLLGDAAGFIDPITGGGIAQALVTSERLAHYIASHGAEHADAWLPAFERDRRVAAARLPPAHARRARAGAPSAAGARRAGRPVVDAAALLAPGRRVGGDAMLVGVTRNRA